MESGGFFFSFSFCINKHHHSLNWCSGWEDKYKENCPWVDLQENIQLRTENTFILKGGNNS